MKKLCVARKITLMKTSIGCIETTTTKGNRLVCHLKVKKALWLILRQLKLLYNCQVIIIFICRKVLLFLQLNACVLGGADITNVSETPTCKSHTPPTNPI